LSNKREKLNIKIIDSEERTDWEEERRNCKKYSR
jgi:hypothetical protein